MMKVKSNNVVRQLAETKDVCNPNLLINADFRNGVINQRRLTTYTGNSSKITYSIDQWFLSKSPSCTLTVNDGYIAVVLPSNQSLGCYIEGDLSGPLTISIKFKDEDVQSLSLNGYTEDEHGDLRYDFGEINNMELHVIKYVQYGDTQFNFWIGDQDAEGSSTLNIEYIKLERGLIFTGMPEWNYATELLECQRYLYFVGSSSILNARYDGSNLCINFKTPMTFVKKPSIVHNNGKFGVTSFNETYEAHNVSDFTVNTYGNGDINIVKPSSNPTRYGMAVLVNGFYLDAEKY